MIRGGATCRRSIPSLAPSRARPMSMRNATRTMRCCGNGRRRSSACGRNEGAPALYRSAERRVGFGIESRRVEVPGKERPIGEEASSIMADLSLFIRHLSKRFGRFSAVEGIDLEVRHGEIMALLGPSGCGKTTTLRMVAGLERPTEGEIRFGDRTFVSVASGV